MSGLLSLPVELIVHIFESTSSVKDAAALSEAAKTLHNIWNERNEQIVAAVLKRQIPAFEDALGLTLAEVSFEALPTSNLDVIDATLYMTGQVSLRTHVRRLLDNAQLAASATRVWRAWIAGLKPSNYRRRLEYGSPYASYYLIRKLALSSRCPWPKLRDELYCRLIDCSEEELNTHDELCTYLCGRCPDEERAKQGISKNKEDWSVTEELEQYGNVDEWDYANEAVGAALRDRLHGTATLKSTMFKDM